MDDNCDGSIDEGVKITFYRDADGDGFGNTSVSTQACLQPTGYVSNSSDCNDNNAAIKPGATETCNGVDDNCNGSVDEGNPGGGASCSTGKLGVCAAGTTACTGGAVVCNQNIAASAEVCNGLDDNCDGSIDEGVKITFYLDSDGDNYGATSPTTQACTRPTGYAANNTDCNDSNANIHPGATEVCFNGVDDNCNGQIDEGCSICLNTTNSFAAASTNWKLYNYADYSPYWYPATSPYTGCRLVTYNSSRKGQVYYTPGRISAAVTVIKFDMAFGGGSDGMALNIIDVNTQTALESYIAATGTGSCMGYGTAGACGSYAVNGVHVKLDSHSNTGDKGYKYEWSATLNGDPENYVPSGWSDAYNGIPGYVDDGYWHHYEVDISGKTIKGYVDGYLLFTGTLPTTFAGGYIGFSAGTGGGYDEFDISSFSITQTSCPP